MKTILFYLCGIYNGGTEVETINLMKNLDRSKYTLYYYYNDKLGSYNEIVKKFDEYASFVNIENEIKVDCLIYCTHALDDMDKIKNIKYNHSYFWFHYFWDDQEKFLEKAIENKYIEKVITMSEYAKKKLEEFDCVKNNKGIVEIIFNIMDDKAIIEKSNDIVPIEKSVDLNLVTVARFAPIKGYHRIKEMIDILIEANVDFRWNIIGKGSNPKEHNEVVEMLKDYPDRISLLGHLSNPFPYIKNADYLVLMSDRETSGLVITEAKILGTPCIVSNFEAAKEQIDDEKTGYIIDKNNILEFKQKLEQIINSKQEMRNNLKDFHFNKEAIMKKWENII